METQGKTNTKHFTKNSVDKDGTQTIYNVKLFPPTKTAIIGDYHV